MSFIFAILSNHHIDRIPQPQREILARQLAAQDTHAGDLLAIQCPTCFASIDVWDVGEEDTYICTQCGGQWTA